MSRALLKKYDAVFGTAVLFGDVPFKLPFAMSYPVRLTPEVAPLVVSYRNPFIHSSSAFRREVVTPGKLYKDIASEEYLLWIEMSLRNARLYRSAIPLIGYRFHGNQVSRAPGFYEASESCEVLNSSRDELIDMVLGPIEMSDSTKAQKVAKIQRYVHLASPGVLFEERFLKFIISKVSGFLTKSSS